MVRLMAGNIAVFSFRFTGTGSSGFMKREGNDIRRRCFLRSDKDPRGKRELFQNTPNLGTAPITCSIKRERRGTDRMPSIRQFARLPSIRGNLRFADGRMKFASARNRSLFRIRFINFMNFRLYLVRLPIFLSRTL